MITNITLTNPDLIRANADNPMINPEQLYKAKPSGHKFSVGDEVELVGLVDFPEFNGKRVAISAIREDGEKGKAYYIAGEINQFLNWVYEYRLK